MQNIFYLPVMLLGWANKSNKISEWMVVKSQSKMTWYKNLSQSEFAARLNKMEVERQNLAEAVTLAERKYSDEKKKVDELQQQVKMHKSNLESSKQELIDYKQKATRILQVSMSCTCLNIRLCPWTERHLRLCVDLWDDLFTFNWISALQVPYSEEL